MTNNPFFSIVIPTYNRANFISKAIESVLAQSFKDFEIVVVDDGSTDETEQVVMSIRNEKVRYFRKENEERAAARNFGARSAKGKYINFLDSDDTIYPHHLQTAKQFCDQFLEVKVFHLGYDIKDVRGVLLHSVSNIKSINRQILSGNVLSCNGVFLKREVMKELQFNEDRLLSSLEDWEFWIRLSARFQFLNSNTITSTVIQHDQRSVMMPDANRIKLKVNKFVKYVLADEINKATFGLGLNKAKASALTYAALHLAMAKAGKRVIIHYLWSGISIHLGEMFKKRFLVIAKELIKV